MIKNLVTGLALTLGLAVGSAQAAGGGGEVTNYDFSFEGAFGAYDQMQLQRGLQIYTEVCASCHGMRYVAFRTLHDEGGPGLPEDQVRAYAANFEIWDPTLLDGDGDFRPGLPTDHFPEGAVSTAPDLSMMAKARAGFSGPMGTGINQLVYGMGGADYIASVLTGYVDPPSCAPDDMDGSYNIAFTTGGYPDECKYEDGSHKYPGSWIAMGQPLWGDDVEYADGHDTSIEAMSQDVAAFLMWSAEPKLNARKQAGFVAVLLLSVLTVLLYLVNKQLWAPVKARAKGSDV